MKHATVIYNKGFYIGDEVKYIEIAPLYLINKGIARLAVDNGLLYYKHDKIKNEIKVGTIDIEKEYRKREAKIKNFKELEKLSEFEKINIYNSISMWLHEEDLFYQREDYINLFFYPIILTYEKFSIKVYPTAKFYRDGKIILSYAIYFDKKISFKKFGNIVCKIEMEKIQSIELPTSFLGETDYDKSSVYISEETEENIEFISLQDSKIISNFQDLSKFLLSLFGAKNISNIFYSRILYLIDSQKLNKEEINKLLNCCMGDTKESFIGKDFRVFKDYYHYQNDTSTVIIGNDSLQYYSSLQSREEYIILKIMEDSIIFKNATENKYSYDQLKDLRLNYMLEENDFACTPYTEINESITDIFNSMNKSLRIQNLNILLEEKIKEKEFRFQNIITFVALLLACQPITDYVLLPLCKLYYNMFGFEYNIILLKLCMFILSTLIISLIYFSIKNKNIK